jgi:YbbR domain-containing protein
MRFHLGTFLLSAVIGLVLWGMAHGTSSIERSVDIPVIFDGVPENLVITGRSADAVNIRVLGSRAALRKVSPTKFEYRIDISDARPGPAIYEVDASHVDQDLPRGARIVSRSPASIEVSLERRGRKSLRVRPDIEGEPAEGFAIAAVEVDPPNVWVTGARSDVLRLSEVVTETIEVAGVDGPIEREIGLSLGSDHVWREEEGGVTVRIQIEPLPDSELDGEAEGAPSET